MSQLGTYNFKSIETITGDDGTAIYPVASNISLLGGAGITTTGDLLTGTISISTVGPGPVAGSFLTDIDWPVVPDALNQTSIGGDAGDNITTDGTTPHRIRIRVSGTTDHAIQLGNAAGSLTSLGLGTNGTVLTGVTGADPAWSATPTLTTVYATTFDTNVAAAGLTLAGTTLAADGTDANISITLDPKGTGVVYSSNGLNVSAGDIIVDAGNVTASGTMYATTFDTNIVAAGVTLSGTTLAADGTDADISITLSPKGTGVVTTDKGFTATSGDIKTTSGNISSSGTVTAGTTAYATTFDTNVATAKLQISGIGISAAGTDANVGISLTPKGTGDTIIAANDLVMTSGNIDIGTTSATAGSILASSDRVFHTFGNNNLFVGKLSGNYTLTVVDSDHNTGIGDYTLTSLTSGAYNLAIGHGSGSTLTSGSYNLHLGITAGGAASVDSTSNIYIGNFGDAESHVIRLGTHGAGDGEQDTCYIAGINGSSGAATGGATIIDTNHKLIAVSAASDKSVLYAATAGATPSFTNAPIFDTLKATTFDTNVAAAKLQISGTTIASTGTDADVNINMTTKGAGSINLTTIEGGELSFRGIEVGYLATRWRTAQKSLQHYSVEWTVPLPGKDPEPIPVHIVEIPLANNYMVSIKAYINGFQSDYDECVGGEIFVTAFRKSTGDIILAGSPIVNVNYTSLTDPSDVDAGIDTSTNSIWLGVVGTQDKTWNWVTTYNYMYTVNNS